MKPRTLVMLLTLLVVVAAALIVSRIDCQRDTAPGDRRMFSELDADIHSIRIERALGPTVAIDLGDSGPRLVEPIDAPARQAHAKQLAAMLRNMTYTRAFNPAGEEGLADSQTGLDQPRLSVTFTDADGETYQLWVGRQAPRVGTDVIETYVRPGHSDQTFVVPRDLGDELAVNVDSLRDLTLLEVSADRVRRLTIQGRDEYTLVRDTDTWRLIEPITAGTDESRVDNLIQKLSVLRANEILTEQPDSLAPYGLDRPQLSVTVEIGPQASAPADDAPADATHTLLLGNVRQDTICAKLADHPAVFTLPKAMLDVLGPSLDEIRSRELVTLSPADVAKVSIEHNGQSLTLQRKDNGWALTQPVEHSADPAAVNTLLRRLTKLQADRWLRTPGELELTSPTATIILTPTDDQAKPARLTIGKPTPDGKDYIVQASHAASPARVPITTIDALLHDEEHYWPRQLSDIGPEARTETLTLRRPTERIVLERLAGGYWRQNEPAPGDANSDRCEAIAQALRSLRAETIVHVGKALPPRFATAEDRIDTVLAVRLPEQNGQPATLKRRELAFVQLNGACYAWPSDIEGRFVVGRVEPDLYTLLAGDVQAPPLPEEDEFQVDAPPGHGPIQPVVPQR